MDSVVAALAGFLFGALCVGGLVEYWIATIKERCQRSADMHNRFEELLSMGIKDELSIRDLQALSRLMSKEIGYLEHKKMSIPIESTEFFVIKKI